MSKNPAILYRVQWIDDPAIEVAEVEDVESWADLQDPPGWAEHCLEMDWPADTEFFWPSTRRTYITREAAEGRAALIKRWGGNVEVIAAETNWLPLRLHDENQEREAARARLAKARNEVAELEELLGMRSPF